MPNPTGTPIHPVAPGVVVRSGDGGGGAGNRVWVQHSNGTVTRYLHMSRIMAGQNDTVMLWDTLGLVGMSGGVSSGPHLHLEMRGSDGTPFNPVSCLP
jgi:murein DD-endopeptidase